MADQPARRVKATMKESVADLRRGVGASSTSRPPESPADAIRYRPMIRPPMALVCILDDGRNEGEWFRIRDDEFTIGRTDGTLRISHDHQISGSHLRIYRQWSNGQFAWHVQDLGSTNGSFVRVASATLRDRQELMIGRHRYRFEAVAPHVSPDESAARNQTRGWQSVNPELLSQLEPSLVRLLPDGEGPRFVLSGNDHIVGKDRARCSVLIDDDPMISGVHTRIHDRQAGQWQIEDLKSVNGTWPAFIEHTIPAEAQLQIGEQRLHIRIP